MSTINSKFNTENNNNIWEQFGEFSIFAWFKKMIQGLRGKTKFAERAAPPSISTRLIQTNFSLFSK